MVDCVSNIDESNENLSAALAIEKGSRNKRKCLSDPPADIPAIAPDAPVLSLTEFSRYKNLEQKLKNALSELGSMIESSEESSKDQEVEESQRAGWDDPVACQLEELLTNNLLEIFRSAVKQIVECGYTEEAAEWAISNSRLSHCGNDAVTNVVDGALALLTRDKEFAGLRRSVFQGLKNLVEYKILEMIHVVREVRPTLTIAEAMWCLLISDLNLLHACATGGPSLIGSPNEEVSGETSAKMEASRNSHLDSDKSSIVKESIPRAQSSQPENPNSAPAHQSRNRPGESGKESCLSFQELKVRLASMAKERILAATRAMDDKSEVSRKVSPGNSKRDLLRQKSFHFEKSYKGRVSKGAFKAKVAAWGSMVLEKSTNSQSGSSATVIKGTYAKLTTSTASSASLVEISNPSSNPQPIVPTPVKDPISALPAANPGCPAPSTPDPNPSPNSETDVSACIENLDCHDENLKCTPLEDKDETILMLVPHKQALEKEIQGWTDWANEKVMQAARRLGKDRGELKTLRLEKEETEKIKKEKQTLEESTMKRLSEMENALSNATGQIEVANCSVRRLESENAALKKEMEAAKVKARASAIDLEEAVAKEQEVMKKCQLWDAEKGLLLEELTNRKRRMAEFQNRVGKAKERQNQFKALLKHEEKEKARIAKQIDSIRQQNERHDALIREEADGIKEMAELKKQKCREYIKNLETEISELHLESNKSKIEALNVGYGNSPAGSEKASSFHGSELPKVGKMLAVLPDNSGSESVGPERECVMCMAEEISVVFLPCAHQVLCYGCSDLHEKRGMNDCPSCRATIQKRINVDYGVVD